MVRLGCSATADSEDHRWRHDGVPVRLSRRGLAFTYSSLREYEFAVSFLF